MEHRARSLISASAIFVGLLLPLRFTSLFWYILAADAALAALAVFWVFAEKPSVKRLKEDWFTIIFLFTFTILSGAFSYLVPNQIVQALLLGLSGVGLYYTYQVASRLKRGYKPALFFRNIVSLTAIMGVFFGTAVALRSVLIFDPKVAYLMVILISFVSVFVVSEFLFEAQGFERSLLYSLAISFGIAQLVWISSFWLISYPQSIKGSNVGVPLPAIFSAIYFYLFWGLSHHRIEGTLTRKVLWEYILIAAGFTLILVLTAKWLP